MTIVNNNKNININYLTIGILFFNESEHDIIRLYKSLKRQTDKRFNLNIIKDYNPQHMRTTQSLDLFKTFSNINIILNEQNLGTTKNRNLIVSGVKTKYFVFIDGDDFVNKEFVSNINNAAKTEDSDLMYYDYRRNDNKGKRYLVSLADYTQNGSLDIARNLKKWALLGCSVMKTEMVVASGMYHETGFEDLDLFLRLFRLEKVKTKYIPGALYFWDNKSSGRNSKGESLDFATVMIANYSTFKYFLHKKEIKELYNNVFNILIKNNKIRIGLIFSLKHAIWFQFPRLIYHFIK